MVEEDGALPIWPFSDSAEHVNHGGVSTRGFFFALFYGTARTSSLSLSPVILTGHTHSLRASLLTLLSRASRLSGDAGSAVTRSRNAGDTAEERERSHSPPVLQCRGFFASPKFSRHPLSHPFPLLQSFLLPPNFPVTPISALLCSRFCEIPQHSQQQQQ